MHDETGEWQGVGYTDEEWAQVAAFLPSEANDRVRNNLESCVSNFDARSGWIRAGRKSDQLAYEEALGKALDLVLTHLQLYYSVEEDPNTAIAIGHVKRLQSRQRATCYTISDFVPSDGRKTPQVQEFVNGIVREYAEAWGIVPSRLSVGAKEGQPNPLMKFLQAATEPVIGSRHPDTLWRLGKTAVEAIRSGRHLIRKLESRP